MRRLLLLTSALLVAVNALAVAPQFWRVQSAEDLLAGEGKGFAITSRGELTPAPAMSKVASFTDPFVLSQAAAPNGDRFFGTGNDGKVYRLRGNETKVLFTSPEPEVYALAFRDGTLFAGTSPNGKVYRIDPDSGAQAVFFDPKQAYIWAVAALPGGELAVATGVEGILYRVSRNGEGKVLFDSPDTHIRSLAVRDDGSVLAGASARGRIYEISRDGSTRALFESSLNEITSVHIDGAGIGWAAGVSNVLPSSAPAKAQSTGTQQQQQQQQQGSSAKKEDESPTVEVSFSFDDSGTLAASQAGSAEVYRIDRDGFVQIVRKFDREMIYSVNAGANGAVLLGTGPNGRVYELRGSELSLIGAVPEKQVVSISTGGGATLVTTTNSGAVYRIEQASTKDAEFRSAAKDVERFSKFGSYQIEGRNLAAGAVAISFRSGNTATPDDTWSAWSAAQTALEGNVPAPAARYIQWKLTMPKGGTNLAVDGVSVAFMNRNIAPQIDAVAVQDPGAVFISAAYPSSPQVVEATNPDEYGIFTSLDSPRDRAAADQGKRMFRKGYRTINWRAVDQNGDELTYTLSFRRKGSDRWLRLRENIGETQLNFDTSQMPDGRYEVRIVASDAKDNPENPLSDTRDGIEFEIDNSNPVVAVAENGTSVVVRVNDTLSPIARVEYSVDAEKWIRLMPSDGIPDGRSETFTLPRNEVAGKFVIVRAVDAFYNVGTESITIR